METPITLFVICMGKYNKGLFCTCQWLLSGCCVLPCRAAQQLQLPQQLTAADRTRHRQPAASSQQSVVGTSNRPPWMPFWSWENVLARLPMLCVVSLTTLDRVNLPARSKGRARRGSTGSRLGKCDVHTAALCTYFVRTNVKSDVYCCCSFAFGSFLLQHNRESLESIWNSPVHCRLLFLINASMRMLLCTALLPAPCTCAAALRSSIAMFTTAADLNAVCFVFAKKILLSFRTTQNFQKFSRAISKKRGFSKILSGDFQKAGIFCRALCFYFCQGCQGIALTLSVKGWKCCLPTSLNINGCLGTISRSQDLAQLFRKQGRRTQQKWLLRNDIKQGIALTLFVKGWKCCLPTSLDINGCLGTIWRSRQDLVRRSRKQGKHTQQKWLLRNDLNISSRSSPTISKTREVHTKKMLLWNDIKISSTSSPIFS